MSDERLENIETLWSLVRRAHTAGAESSAVDARRTLVLRYAPAIRRYLGGILRDSVDSEELAQDVVVRLLKGDFAGADPNRGRFRDLLKIALRNMVRNHWAKQKRRSAHALPETLSDDSAHDQDSNWTAAWQSTVLDQAWAALRESERRKKGAPLHWVLKWRVDFPEETSDQLAERLTARLGSAVTAVAARQMLRRARLRFAQVLIDEVALSLDAADPSLIEGELAALGLLEYVKEFLPENWRLHGKLVDE